MKRLAFAAVLAAVALPAVSAANVNGDIYGAVMGTYEVKDKDRDDLRGGIGGTSLIGLPVNKYFSFEPNFWAESVRRKSDGGSDAQYGGGLDLNLHQSNGLAEGFLLFGGGVERDYLAFAPKDNTFKGYADAGAGIVFRLNKNFAVRTEGKYYRSFDRSDSYPGQHTLGDYRVSVGLQYSLGDVIPTPLPPPAPPPPPPPPKVFAPPPPPPPAPCTDSDGDGVCDAVDKCPGTPHGFKVDANGCIIEQTVILRTVNFEFNKATLTPESKVALDEVARGLIGQPTLKVEVSGHTDSIGSAPYNLALSKKRAASVVAYLTSKGLPKSHMSSRGYGKTKPIADNKTAEGRAENRRVEFKVTAGEAVIEKKTPGGKTIVKVPQRKHPHPHHTRDVTAVPSPPPPPPKVLAAPPPPKAQ